jgi:uncharacterized damage-inducible protein DinB
MSFSPSDGFPYYLGISGSMNCHNLFSSTSTFEFLESIDEKKATYRYSNNKWNIKQIVGHITDHERIKISRAHLLSRSEPIQLWGYDQNALVKNSRFDELSFKHLVIDFENVRKGSISFLQGLSEGQLKIKGMANEYEITLEEFLKSIIGHEVHHINIIKEKYL